MPTPAATAVWEMCVWGGKAVTFCCDDQEASSRSMHAQATIGASVCKASNVHLCNVRRSAMPLCISVNAGEWGVQGRQQHSRRLVAMAAAGCVIFMCAAHVFCWQFEAVC